MPAETEQIATFIRDELAYDGALDPSADLLEEKILDSFSIVQVALFLQEEFDIELDADDLNRDNLSSIDSMLALVEAKRNA